MVMGREEEMMALGKEAKKQEKREASSSTWGKTKTQPEGMVTSTGTEMKMRVKAQTQAKRGASMKGRCKLKVIVESPTKTERGARGGPDVVAKAEAEAGVEVGAKAGAEAKVEAGVEAGAEVEAEASAQAEAQAEPGAETGAEAKVEAKAEKEKP
jgi:hypothetical protein